MSLGVAVFILIHSIKNLKKVLDLFLEKTPDDIDIPKLKEHLLKIKGIDDMHHIHVWSIHVYINHAAIHMLSKSKDIKT